MRFDWRDGVFWKRWIRCLACLVMSSFIILGGVRCVPLCVHVSSGVAYHSSYGRVLSHCTVENPASFPYLYVSVHDFG